MTAPENAPPRSFGALLAFLGFAFSAGGVNLMLQGDNAYFLVVGLGILISGVLIAQGKMMGAWVYLGVFALIVMWSVVETGFDLGKLLPRVFMPALICIYVFTSRVRSRLS
jgi:glucose dehydrogenase